MTWQPPTAEDGSEQPDAGAVDDTDEGGGDHLGDEDGVHAAGDFGARDGAEAVRQLATAWVALLGRRSPVEVRADDGEGGHARALAPA